MKGGKCHKHNEIYQPTSAILLSILSTFVDPPLSTIPVSSQEELPVRIDQSIVMQNWIVEGATQLSNFFKILHHPRLQHMQYEIKQAQTQTCDDLEWDNLRLWVMKY